MSEQPFAEKDAAPSEQDHDCAETCACGGAYLHGRKTVLTDAGSEEHTRTICGRLSDVDRMLRARVLPPDEGRAPEAGDPS